MYKIFIKYVIYVKFKRCFWECFYDEVFNGRKGFNDGYKIVRYKILYDMNWYDFYEFLNDVVNGVEIIDFYGILIKWGFYLI